MTNSLSRNYLFYDLETTGLNPCFDQILQFAAIRTDLELNELDRYEYQIKLNPDVIPSPYAIITHRMGWQAMQQGGDEYQTIQTIHNLLNAPGTISVGYNTLGFDDEFLRFNFYRNLLPPYTHQFANNCSRMDLLPITLLFYLYQPDIIQWPTVNDAVSLKLEKLNELNQWVSGMSHNAMVDVDATLALARTLSKSTEMWQYVTGFFEKATDLSRMNQLSAGITNTAQHYPQALLINLRCGYANNYQMPVLGLGQHRHYKNQTLWLRLDVDELRTSTIDNFLETTYIIRKKVAEPPLLLPTKERFISRLAQQRRDTMTTNLHWLEEHPDILQTIADHYLDETYPTINNLDPDAALYQIGFATREEENLFRQFHRAAPTKKWNIAQRFPNPIRQQQALRILGRHFSDSLSTELQEDFQTQSDNATVDYRNVQKYTAEQAHNDISQLKQQALDAEQLQLLEEYTQALGQRADKKTTHE